MTVIGQKLIKGVKKNTCSVSLIRIFCAGIPTKSTFVRVARLTLKKDQNTNKVKMKKKKNQLTAGADAVRRHTDFP